MLRAAGPSGDHAPPVSFATPCSVVVSGTKVSPLCEPHSDRRRDDDDGDDVLTLLTSHFREVSPVVTKQATKKASRWEKKTKRY